MSEENKNISLDELEISETSKNSYRSNNSISGDISENELEENSSQNKNISLPKSNYNNLNISTIDSNSNKIKRNKIEYHLLKNIIHLRINFLVNLNYFIKNCFGNGGECYFFKFLF